MLLSERRMTTWSRRDFEREEGSFPQLHRDKTHEAEEDGNLSGGARKMVKKLTCVQAFCF